MLFSIDFIHDSTAKIKCGCTSSRSYTMKKSTEVEEIIFQLKEALVDLLDSDEKLRDDLYLLQWLKARKLNVRHTEAAIRASFKWRKENNVDALETEQFPKPLFDGNPFVWDFESKTGAPVCYVREDDMGLAGFLRLYGRSTMVRFITLQLVRLEKVVIEFNGKRKEDLQSISLDSSAGLTAVFDGEGYGLRHVASWAALRFYFEIAQIYGKYFPAISNVGYFLNASTFAMISFQIIKPLLEGPHTTIKLYGTERKSWEPEVFELIAPETFHRLQERVRNRNEYYKVNPPTKTE